MNNALNKEKQILDGQKKCCLLTGSNLSETKNTKLRLVQPVLAPRAKIKVPKLHCTIVLKWRSHLYS